MGKTGSATQPGVLPAWMALAAFAGGLVAMGLAARQAAGLGMRPAITLAEAFLALPALLALSAFGIPWSRGLGLVRLSTRGWVLSGLAGVTLWSASLGLLELQYGFWAPPPGYLESFQAIHQALRPSGWLDAMGSILAIALAPALCEELLLRGVLLPSFLRALRPWGAIIASALLFGLIHVDPDSQGARTFYRVPFTLAVGIGLGFVRVRSGSLWPGVVAHAVLNTITFSAVLYGGADTTETANVPRGAALFLGGVAASVLLLRWFPRRPDAVWDPDRLNS